MQFHHFQIPFIATFSGLRWTVDDTDKKELFKRIKQYCISFAQFASDQENKLIIVGRDGRQSGDEYPSHVIQALTSQGFKVMYIGIVPTPTVQEIVKINQAAGGVIITASHNPNNWCGLKFVSKSTVFLTPDECKVVYGNIKDCEPYETIPVEQLENVRICDNKSILRQHIYAILLSQLIVPEIIQQRHFRVGFNGMCASGAVYAPLLAQALNLELLPFNFNIGKLPENPEPTPQNLQDFSKYLKDEINKGKRLDIAFAVDPDADRCVVLDEHGNVLNEELTLALCAMSYLSHCENPDKQIIVKNQSTSSIINHIAEIYHAQCEESPTGEINVVLLMQKLGASFGGEGNGGCIYGDVHYGRDSLCAICLILQMLAETGATISEIANNLPKLTMKKYKYSYSVDRSILEKKMEQLKEKQGEQLNIKYKVKKILDADGLKIYFEDQSWLSMRFSNTEPIMRFIAEGLSETDVDSYIEKAKQYFDSN